MHQKINQETTGRPSARLRKFHIDVADLPLRNRGCNSRDDKSDGNKITAEIVTPSRILSYGPEARQQLTEEIIHVLANAFPKMSADVLDAFAGFSTSEPSSNFNRQVVLFRDSNQRLVGLTIFDHGSIGYECKHFNSIYILTRSFLPEYQGGGLGQLMAAKILSEMRPDLLLTTCNQSFSLHSWLRLAEKSLITGYDIYPRIEENNQSKTLVTVPHKELDFYIDAFRQSFWGVYDNGKQKVAQAMNNLTIQMVRKNVHNGAYDFSPWKKENKTDQIAQALGVTERDGILVIFRKQCS